MQFILLLFGLVNAGVTFSSVGMGSWFVLSSLVIGKPLGIVATTFLAVRMGLRAPGGLSYLDTAGAGSGGRHRVHRRTVLCDGGVSALAPILDEVKMGALLSFLAAPLAIGIGRIVRVDSHLIPNHSSVESLNRPESDAGDSRIEDSRSGISEIAASVFSLPSTYSLSATIDMRHPCSMTL